jgi:hypothetical protein
MNSTGRCDQQDFRSGFIKLHIEWGMGVSESGSTEERRPLLLLSRAVSRCDYNIGYSTKNLVS